MSTTALHQAAAAQQPKVRAAFSDVEEGEVTESDNETAPIVVVPPTLVVVADDDDAQPLVDKAPKPSATDDNSGDGQRGEKDSGTGAESQGSSKLARKRQNRTMRKQQELTEKKAKTNAQIQQLEAAEMDEYEMLCVRGASPPPMLPFDGAATFDKRAPAAGVYGSDDDSDNDDQRYLRSTFLERREHRRKRSRRRKRTASTDDPQQQQSSDHKDDGICFRNYRGQCADASCKRSHEFRMPRKLELCKFFLTGQCIKSRNCTYMHTEFPCKFYYLGIAHDAAKCMFAHGAPLEPALQGALLKHIERAPKQILGDFPKMYQSNAGQMMRAQHEKLVEEFNNNKGGGGGGGGSDSTDAPSKSKKRKKKRSHRNDADHEIAAQMPLNDPGADESGRWSPSGKLRQFHTVATPSSIVANHKPTIEPALTGLVRAASPVTTRRRLDRMADILTANQVAQLRGIGVEFDHQIDQLTVAQMNDIGVSIAQIHQIQMSALQAKRQQEAIVSSEPIEAVPSFKLNGFYQDSTSQDIDMRFPVRGSGGVRQPLPDLSAFGIEAGRAAAVANNSSPVTTQSNGTPSDRRPLSFSNAFVLDAKVDSAAENDDHDDDDDDDDDGQLVINDESDSENANTG